MEFIEKRAGAMKSQTQSNAIVRLLNIKATHPPWPQEKDQIAFLKRRIRLASKLYEQ